MKITIEITSAELAQLVEHLHLKQVPCVLNELHEDFEEDPEETDIKPEPEPEPDPNPQPEQSPKPAKGQNGGIRSKRHVEVKIGDNWMSFPSMTAAAKRLGCYPSQVSSSLANGWTCKGFEVRYGPEESDEEVLPR